MNEWHDLIQDMFPTEDKYIAREVWHVGERALCHSDHWTGVVPGPVKGQVRIVTAVAEHPTNPNVQGLGFAEYGKARFNSNCFTKLPDLDEEVEDEREKERIQ